MVLPPTSPQPKLMLMEMLLLKVVSKNCTAAWTAVLKPAGAAATLES